MLGGGYASCTLLPTFSFLTETFDGTLESERGLLVCKESTAPMTPGTSSNWAPRSQSPPLQSREMGAFSHARWAYEARGFSAFGSLTSKAPHPMDAAAQRSDGVRAGSRTPGKRPWVQSRSFPTCFTARPTMKLPPPSWLCRNQQSIAAQSCRDPTQPPTHRPPLPPPPAVPCP